MKAEKYVENEDDLWQIEAIEEGVKVANEGKFASDEDVQIFFSKWGVDAQI